MKVLISIFVITTLLFGGAMTVRAAQDDLPDEPLYAVKLWSEDVSLQFQKTDDEKVDRLMGLAQVRVQEMAQINDAGKPVPNQVLLRLEQHIEQALQFCSTMNDTKMDQTLLRLRDQLLERDHDLEQLQVRARQDARPILEQTREMLQLRLQLVNGGLLDHEMFRNAAHNGFRQKQYEPCVQCTSPTPTSTVQPPSTPTWMPNSSTATPDGTMMGTGGPNPGSGGMNATPVNPYMTPGGPNSGMGGNNHDGGGNMNGSGSGSGGNGPGGNSPGGGGGGGGNGGGGNRP